MLLFAFRILCLFPLLFTSIWGCFPAQLVSNGCALVFKAAQLGGDGSDGEWMLPMGRIDFHKIGRAQMTMNGTLSGLEALRRYRLEVHQFGDLGDFCAETGPPFQPRNRSDAPELEADLSGTLRVQSNWSTLALNGRNSVIGRALVVHELGEEEDSDSDKLWGCGVIGILGSGRKRPHHIEELADQSV